MRRWKGYVWLFGLFLCQLSSACDLYLLGSGARKRIVLNALDRGISENNEDILGLHIAPVEAVLHAMEHGYFPVNEDNKGRFFLLPIKDALKDDQIKAFYQANPNRFREESLPKDLLTAKSLVKEGYGTSPLATYALFRLLRLEGKVSAQEAADKMVVLAGLDPKTATEQISQCYRGEPCGNVRKTIEFLKAHAVSLEDLLSAYDLAIHRKGVLLAVSRQWVEKNSSVLKGDRHGEPWRDEDKIERYADIGVSVVEGLPIRAVIGIEPLGHAEKTLFQQLREQQTPVSSH